LNSDFVCDEMKVETQKKRHLKFQEQS
jgi:hypothetical protein